MGDDNFEPAAPFTLKMLAGESLDALSIDDLEQRVVALEAEIARVRIAIEAKRKSRFVAEDFFKTKQ
ncbi:MAG: DUF1192 domain-containing protein [Sphingomonadales bacterium]